MHIYIYDAFVNQKKYEPVLARIETRITDLGLSGKIVRLGLMKNVREAVENQIKQGAKTLVVVGNNQTVHQVINAIARINPTNLLGQAIPLGIIPIGKKNNEIAISLGIELEEMAGDVLSSRRIEVLDLGLANKHYFVSQATITSQDTTLEIDQNYCIEIIGPGEINVINLAYDPKELPRNISPNPQDNILDLFVNTATSKKFLRSTSSRPDNQNIFSFKNLTILNKTHPLILDKAVKVTAPVDIKLAPQKLPMIVGKDRGF